MTLIEIDTHKQNIAAHFSKAAISYAAHNGLQKQCARQLLALLPDATAITVDAGCGPGVNTTALTQRASHYIGLDLASGMLQQAKNKHPSSRFVLADVERLPFNASSVDTIFANLALQWVNDLTLTLEQFVHCLTPNGQMLFSTVLAGSMAPLGAVFKQVTGHSRHNEFMTSKQLQATLEALPSVSWQLQTQQIKVPYRNFRAMLADLKGVGATYQRKGSHYLRKTALIAAEELMESYREDNESLYLYWEIGFCKLIKN